MARQVRCRSVGGRGSSTRELTAAGGAQQQALSLPEEESRYPQVGDLKLLGPICSCGRSSPTSERSPATCGYDALSRCGSRSGRRTWRMRRRSSPPTRRACQSWEEAAVLYESWATSVLDEEKDGHGTPATVRGARLRRLRTGPRNSCGERRTPCRTFVSHSLHGGGDALLLRRLRLTCASSRAAGLASFSTSSASACCLYLTYASAMCERQHRQSEHQRSNRREGWDLEGDSDLESDHDDDDDEEEGRPR